MNDEVVIYCTECGEECAIVEETFSYSGSHRTNGIPGIHRTGNWISECCLAETTDTPPDEKD